jgi:hypothetical protein
MCFICVVAWPAARDDPAHRAIGQDDAKLGFKRTEGFHRVLDRRRAHGAVVGMDATAEARHVGVEMNGFAWREAEELPSFVR